MLITVWIKDGTAVGSESDGRLMACRDSSGRLSFTRNIKAASSATRMPTASVMCFMVIFNFIVCLLANVMPVEKSLFFS
jgi:hypothetical protein